MLSRRKRPVAGLHGGTRDLQWDKRPEAGLQWDKRPEAGLQQDKRSEAGQEAKAWSSTGQEASTILLSKKT